MPEAPVDLHTGDLAWARELAEGRREAIERYERELVPAITQQLAHRGFSQDEIAELQQTLRVRLFVGDDGPPAIASYAGRGKLKSWVLVASLREAVRARQKQRREPATDDDALIALADRTDGLPPTLDKDRARETLRAALRIALAALPSRDRNLLRLGVIDGLTVDQIGALLGVHRATAARWLTSARDAITRGVRREVQRAVGADPFEAESLMRWADSRIDVSLTALADTEPRR